MKSESEQRENTNRARVYKYFLRIRLNLNIGDSNGWRNIKSIYNWTAHEMEMLVGIHMAKVWSKSKNFKCNFSSSSPGRAGFLGPFLGLNPYVT